ncbi:MAG TPA: MerR family transcriptional regulator, partial [Aeromicrobium sp.]|nr:MerR family transcriptional regulator [Aeromicrobium sp.]
MENARTAMSIGEFARRVALSVSALRFYDECGLLRPAAVEASTGYRFYDESQIGVAELVRDLRQLRLPVARVRELLELPADARHQAVERQVEALTAELAAALEAARVLHRRIDLLEGDMTITVNGAELADGLRHAIAAAGTDDERPALKAVLIEAKNGSVRLVATDSFRLTIRDLVNQAGVGDSLRTLVDASRLSEAVEWIAEQDSVELKANGALVLRAAGSERSLPTVAGPYPEYEG